MKNTFASYNKETQIGVGCAISAYILWGFLPIYWKSLQGLPAVEILAHRMVWSVIFLCLVLAVQKRLGEIWHVVQSPKYIAMLLGTSFLLGSNWFIYIYAVNTDRIIESSLGYFCNPLLNVLLGALILKERLNVWQIGAVCLAAIGVLNYLWSFGSLPWISILIAVSFSLYGLCRKMIPVKPLVGLLVETALLAPIALYFIVSWNLDGSGSFGKESSINLLLVGSGVMTSLPLIFFINAGKRLRFSTLGIIQYLTPSISLLIGVFLYKESFTTTHAVTFAFIWLALAIYTFNSLSNSIIINNNNNVK